MNKNKGFTLIEIAIVLVIIGIILSAVMLRSGSVIGNAKTTNTIALIKDLTAAINDFKNRYHYLPGDLPNAANDISSIAGGTTCDISPNGTIGDGQIDGANNAERDCVAVELVQAGLIKGNTTGIVSPYNSGQTPDVFVLARSKASVQTFPQAVQNVIEIQNIPCDATIAIDSKIDDGDTKYGNVRSNPPCDNGASGIPATTYLDVAL